MRRLVESRDGVGGGELLGLYWVGLDHKKLKSQTMSIK